MTISTAGERRMLAHEEFELIKSTHHPDIQSLDLKALQAARADLRKHQEKARTIAHHKRREARGKGEARAAGASGNADHARRRKQIFAQALKRTNRQITRLEAEAARAVTSSGVRRALAAKQARPVHHPGPAAHANTGATPKPSKATATKVPAAKKGSVSKAGKVAQAKRDG